MTREEREEAIRILNTLKCEYLEEYIDYAGIAKTYDVAIEALKQEPCEDAVSRQAALEALNCEISGSIESDIDLSKYKREFQEFADMILKSQEKAIQALLPVAPTQRWIPVSERLPKEFEFVNCTCHSLIDDREDWVIETVYIPMSSDSSYSDWGNIPMLNSGGCEVVAWMHRDIPEPYKAEKER